MFPNATEHFDKIKFFTNFKKKITNQVFLEFNWKFWKVTTQINEIRENKRQKTAEDSLNYVKNVKKF